MNISRISRNPINFNALYKTEDVLSFITGYPYKNKSVNEKMVQSLTGVHLGSQEFFSRLPKDATYLFVYESIIAECHDEIIKQHPELIESDDSFDCKLHLKEGKKAQEAWFETQLKNLKVKMMNIEPFELKRERVEKRYTQIESVFNEIL